MAYQTFAAYYDRLTEEIDYAKRAAYFDQLIRKYLAVDEKTILLDLACGTGSLSVELCRLGYDVIGVDGSAEMLCEAYGKQSERPILYLCQPMDRLDLYGTVDITICALDSLNHLADPDQLERTIKRVALFTAPGGLFLFDVNTPYKHREILGNQTFVYDLDDLYCVWQNTTDENLVTEISLDFFVRQGDCYFRESEHFLERCYSREYLAEELEKVGFRLLGVYRGDALEPLGEKDQRAVFLAQKREG